MHPTLRPFRPLPLLLCGALAIAAAPAHAYDAEVISVISKGEARATTRDDWKPATIRQQLNAGAFVRTGDLSQMALLLRDQTQLRLNQNSMLQIKEVSPSGEPTKLELTQGRVWAQAKRKTLAAVPSQQPAVTVQTPNAIAAIRGTDWELAVDKDGSATLTVLSGEVEFYNDLGRVSVRPNEQARVEPGKAPTKVLLTNARERVQWVTAYRPQPRRWLPKVPADLQTLVEAIEAGRYGDALGALEARTKQSADAPPALLLADLYLFLGRVPEAIGLLESRAAQGQGDARAAALLSRAYLIADRADAAGQLLAAARAKHPEDVELRLALGDLARVSGDAPAARTAFKQALAGEPDNAEAWFGVGRIESEREDVKAGRNALNRAIALNPVGAGYRGELATLESFANEFPAAEKAFNEALAQQPDDYVALTGLGILQLKRGDPDAALEFFLKAGVMEPRYARSSLYSGVAYYQLGNRVRAEEMFRRAAEIDAKDPLPHMMLSLVAADRMELGQAVDSARRAAELMPYLKSLNQLLNNQKGNANVGAALAQFGLEEWAHAYAYDAYTPYWAGSHLFLADRYSGSFNKNSELFKGFLSDPTVFGASNRFNTLVASPGHYATVGGRLVNQDWRERNASAVVNGYSAAAAPFAYYLGFDRAQARPADSRLSSDGDNLALGLGVRPSHELGLFLFNNTALIDAQTNDPTAGLVDDRLRLDSRRLDVGANYKFSPTSHAWLKLGQGDEKTTVSGSFFSPGIVGALNTLLNSSISPTGRINDYRSEADQRDWQWRHTFDATAAYQLSWGLEYATQKKPLYLELGFAPVRAALRQNTEHDSREAYVSNRYKPNDALLLQLDLSYLQLNKRYASDELLGLGAAPMFNLGATSRDDRDINEWNPRLGLAWHPAAGHTLRLAAQKWRRPAGVNTLAPVDTAGVAVDDRLVSVGGELKRARAQYEWAASASTFVQGFLDYKEARNQANPGGTLVADLNLQDLERLRNRNRLSPLALDLWEATPEFGAARVDAAGIAVNQLLSRTLSANARYQYSRSRNTGDGLRDNRVPWLPRHLFSAGANWLPAARWQLGLNAAYRSKRYADEANTQQINAGWNLGLRSYWESPDKRLSVEVIGENLHADKNSAPTRSAILGAQVLYRF